ncbi:hypothetical protein [Nakamurella sp. PAMC28650]|uniref:hypothetical protein n=1 Tax=Nakamurella sp. PAMC28650 TaxID=2762325 RepID=UPI00164ED6D8|nr:hypothetical protein [Nakamurella sp. PAMC28650]QNK82575.1 hypothetical protein H7F38_07675 [Nakamurella sp. PAMC28650]
MKLNLFKRSTPTESTAEAIDRAAAHASAIWMHEATKIVIKLGQGSTSFTTDQVHAELSKMDVATPEPRALGAVIRQAIRDGFIVLTGEYRKSARRVCHKRPMAVYRPAVQV